MFFVVFFFFFNESPRLNKRIDKTLLIQYKNALCNLQKVRNTLDFFLTTVLVSDKNLIRENIC